MFRLGFPKVEKREVDEDGKEAEGGPESDILGSDGHDFKWIIM
jgi:hypothetical protein